MHVSMINNAFSAMAQIGLGAGRFLIAEGSFCICCASAPYLPKVAAVSYLPISYEVAATKHSF